jgi:hypothetical protein
MSIITRAGAGEARRDVTNDMEKMKTPEEGPWGVSLVLLPFQFFCRSFSEQDVPPPHILYTSFDRLIGFLAISLASCCSFVLRLALNIYTFFSDLVAHSKLPRFSFTQDLGLVNLVNAPHAVSTEEHRRRCRRLGLFGRGRCGRRLRERLGPTSNKLYGT